MSLVNSTSDTLGTFSLYSVKSLARTCIVWHHHQETVQQGANECVLCLFLGF